MTPGAPRTIVAHNGARLLGGAELWTVQLLLRLQRRGHRALLLCRDPDVQREVEALGVEAEVLHLGGQASIHDALRLAARLARHRPDGLLLSTFNKVWLGGMGARLARVPRVIARIGLSTDLPSRNPLYGLAFRRWVHRVAANADCIRVDILASLPGLDPRRVVTLYSGVDPPARRGPPGAVRRSLALGDDARVVGTVARLAGQKRLDRLIATVARLPSDVHCIIAGDGPERGGLEARAQELGVSGRVHFLGAREDVGDVLDALDLFLLTSRSEGMSNAMLEALAAGVPVLSTPVSGAAEALDPLADGRRPGAVVEAEGLADAACALLADPARLAEMGGAARARGRERFNWDAKLPKWEALLLGDPMASVHEGASPLHPKGPQNDGARPGLAGPHGPR